MQLDEKQNENQNNQISDSYLSQLAQGYGVQHSGEVDKIVPWKNYLDCFMWGILLSLITLTDIEWLRCLTQTYGLAILVYGLGNMQQSNRFFVYGYRVGVGFLVYHLVFAIFPVPQSIVYVMFGATLSFYCIILSLFIKGMGEMIDNPQRIASIKKSLDGIIWSGIYIFCLFAFATVTGRGAYRFDSAFLGGFWAICIAASCVWWGVNFGNLSKKLALDGYGIQVVSADRKRKILVLVWSWAILFVVIRFMSFL